jgi:hypothetical protein
MGQGGAPRRIGRAIPIGIGAVVVGLVAIGTLVARPFDPPTATPIPVAVATAEGSTPPVPVPTRSLSAVAERAMTVSAFLAAQRDGSLPDGEITLRGFWTSRWSGRSCPVSTATEGELEMSCYAGSYGINERNEPLWIDDERPSAGPVIQPFIDGDVMRVHLLEQTYANGQWYPPIPIVVAGHVNDPRTAECAAGRRHVCRDRFVITGLLEFDLASVPAPLPTPPPTPFPYDDPPPAPFGPHQCAGEVDYVFANWMKSSELPNGDTSDVHPVYVMTTRDVVLFLDWDQSAEDPEKQHRVWGQVMCIGPERPPDGSGTVLSKMLVPGTGIKELQDGTRIPIE